MYSTFLRHVTLFTLAALMWGCPAERSSEKQEVVLIVIEDDSGTPSADMARDMPDMPDMPAPDLSQLDLGELAMDMPKDLSTPSMPPDMLRDMPPAIEPGPVVLATFNVELFFDDMCDTGSCDADSFERLFTTQELQSRYATTGAAIDRLAADIIVLQEIEKENLFETLLSTTQQGYTAMTFGETGREASIDVGIAARGELLEVRRHRQDDLVLPDGSQSRFARELLEVHLRIRGARVVVFGAHYISKFNPDNDLRRAAEAARTAKLALDARARHPDALILIAGDLNDTPESETLRQFTDAGLTLTSQSRDIQEVYTNVYGFDLQIIDHIIYLQTPGVSFEATSGLEVLRDSGERGLAGSDHAAPRDTFVFE